MSEGNLKEPIIPVKESEDKEVEDDNNEVEDLINFNSDEVVSEPKPESIEEEKVDEKAENSSDEDNIEDDGEPVSNNNNENKVKNEKTVVKQRKISTTFSAIPTTSATVELEGNYQEDDMYEILKRSKKILQRLEDVASSVMTAQEHVEYCSKRATVEAMPNEDTISVILRHMGGMDKNTMLLKEYVDLKNKSKGCIIS